MTTYTPTHARPYSHLRELNTPQRQGRHDAHALHLRLGADHGPDLTELLAASVASVQEGRRRFGGRA